MPAIIFFQMRTIHSHSIPDYGNDAPGLDYLLKWNGLVMHHTASVALIGFPILPLFGPACVMVVLSRLRRHILRTLACTNLRQELFMFHIDSMRITADASTVGKGERVIGPSCILHCKHGKEV